ncbi:4-(cytidine 5'-diphospho)-2-C-methyl-D-erythritol kinase [Oleidesulfovibrio sp.]|uniref:4-(cytidine 5'-diphospho)-2-C-methyl-D-erythritol kinase n=1 Tax=Oleidesulfovibrio sp. TaxID=2909707 RepID=UPI003A88EF29
MPSFTAQTLRSGCKINLHLQIKGELPNGYHELETLFYPLAVPYDEMHVTPASDGITIECERNDLCGENNIICKAWEAYKKAGGPAPAMKVHLKKGVPDGAGLGGGSANASKILTFLNSIAGEEGLTAQQMNAVAASVGADVPFFLHNKPCLATGIGEKLLPLPLDLCGWYLVLVCPGVQVPTAWAYGQWDSSHKPDSANAVQGPVIMYNPEEVAALSGLATSTELSSGHSPTEWKKNTNDNLTTEEQADSKPVSRALWLFNSFETVVFSVHSELRQYKNLLLMQGASAALMSGSGSSLFGFFRDKAEAESAAQLFIQSGVATYFHRL